MIIMLGMLMGMRAIPARAAGHTHDRNVLWRIVHTQCMAAAARRTPPSPCTRLWLDQGALRGYALFKDRRGPAQYLLIPTARISGIESPALLAPGAPNYFAAAWSARHYVGAALGRDLPRDDIALAVNSRRGRSQDQLHIHVDCASPALKATLARVAPHLNTHWRWLAAPLHRHRYRAMRVMGASLRVNPFRLLARRLPRGQGMGAWTLVVAGHTFGHAPGFVILAAHADKHDPASGEELQDHSCAVVRSHSHTSAH